MTAVRACLAALLLFAVPASSLSAQGLESDEAFSERTRVTAVDVVVEAKNPARIEADDLTVTDDGSERPVVRVGPLSDGDAEPFRMVLYFDLPLATAGTIQAAISSLAEQVVPLTSLGTIEVVVADLKPRTLLPPTDNPELLNQALSRLLLRLQSTNALNEIRRLALAAAEGDSQNDDDQPIDAKEAVRREVDLIMRQQDELLIWVADDERATGPRAIFLVSDGFDLDPGFFYSSRVPGPNNGAWAQNHLARTNADLAKSLAGYGWLTFPLTFRSIVPDPEERVSDFDRERYRTMDGPNGDRTALVPFNLKGGKKKRQREAAAGFLLLEPLEPLAVLAEATGGRMIDRSTAIQSELTALDQRLLVTFQASGTIDGRLRSLSISARNREALAPGWVRSGTPEPVAEARIRRLLSGGREAAGLDVEAQWAARSDSGPGRELEVELTLAEETVGEATEMPTMRLTLGQATEGGPITFQHLVVNNRDYDGDRWSYSATFKPLPNSDWLVLLVEDLVDGSWGAEALEPPAG